MYKYKYKYKYTPYTCSTLDTKRPSFLSSSSSLLFFHSSTSPPPPLLNPPVLLETPPPRSGLVYSSYSKVDCFLKLKDVWFVQSACSFFFPQRGGICRIRVGKEGGKIGLTDLRRHTRTLRGVGRCSSPSSSTCLVNFCRLVVKSHQAKMRLNVLWVWDSTSLQHMSLI